MAEKTILITGGTGFIGFHLANLLRKVSPEDTKVVTTGLRQGSLPGNLASKNQTALIFERYRPDVVYHLASRVGGIGANQDKPWEFLVDTLRMGINVIEACGETGVKDLILVGSVCCYPYEPPTPFKEEDLWSGYPEETNAPYGIAKRTLQEALKAGGKKYGFRYAFPIPTNVYGPGEHFDLRTSHVIPAVIEKVQRCIDEKGTHIPLWGSGAVSRDFLFVKDVVYGLYACHRYMTETGNSIDKVNLGTGVETPIWKVAETIRNMMRCEAPLMWNTSMPDGQPRRVLDVSKAKELLDWQAHIDLQDGLERMLEWYKIKRSL